MVAQNSAFAKSKFWKIMRTQNKIKKSQGEVLRIQEVHGSSKVEARNYGIYLKYHTNVGDKNMFKEYRAESVKSALDQMYNEMGGNYSVSRDRVDVIKTVELTEEQLRIKKPRCLQYKETASLAVPVWKKNARPSLPQFRKSFVKVRPTTFKTGNSIEI